MRVAASSGQGGTRGGRGGGGGRPRVVDGAGGYVWVMLQQLCIARTRGKRAGRARRVLKQLGRPFLAHRGEECIGSAASLGERTNTVRSSHDGSR